uniref:Endothelin-converting enzyme 1-like protein 5 n=1 Tax=Ampulex compressa TaxID=860918 RepID=A0A1W6EW24_AMPCP|nr:endothelin-converting enzyme 1-like protein 5 [Ampulex compressa]
MEGSLGYSIATLLIRVSVIFILTFPAVHLKDPWKPTSTAKNPICVTSECVSRGKMYYKNWDPMVHPCDDFYKFACNNWHDTNPTPLYTWEWNSLAIIENEIAKQVRDIVQKFKKRSDSAALAQLKTVYRTCMYTPSMKAGDIRFVWQHMKKAGFDTSAPWWEVHQNYLEITGESALMTIKVVANSQHNFNPILKFSEIGSPYGSIIHGEVWIPSETDMYINLLKYLCNTQYSNMSPVRKQLPTLDFMQIVLFRHRLNEISRECMQLKHRRVMPMTVKEFENWFNKLGNEGLAKVGWRRIVRVMLDDIPDAVIDHDGMIAVRREEYFKKLNELLAKTPKDIIVAHLHVYFLERYLNFGSKAEELQQKLLSFGNGVNAYRRYEREKWLMCLEDINMNTIQGKLYIHKYFDKNLKHKITILMDELKQTMIDEISRSTWMDDETKEKSISRMKAVTTWVGYPEWYDNPDVQRSTNDVMNPMEANAFYYVAENRVVITAAILHSPIYEAEMSPVVNYGTAGFFFAHELFHMFQECGNLYFTQEQLVPWWSLDMRKECKKRKACFVKQYSQYVIPELVGYTKQCQVDGERTYEENVADVMGLKAAYRLHAQKVKKNNGKCQVLPKFSKFTCDQLFFLAFANTLCGHTDPQYVRFKHKITRHSPRSIRVNAALWNIDAFRRAFDCGPQKGLKSEETCDFWK